MISLIANELPNLTRLIGQRFALNAVNSIMYEQDCELQGGRRRWWYRTSKSWWHRLSQPVNVIVDLRSTWSWGAAGWRVLCPGAGSSAKLDGEDTGHCSAARVCRPLRVRMPTVVDYSSRSIMPVILIAPTNAGYYTIAPSLYWLPASDVFYLIDTLLCL